MKYALSRWLTVWLLAFGTAMAAPTHSRFSHTLNEEEKGESGLTRLSSDEVAVIDALVRRDTATRAGSTTPAGNSENAAVTFSQRLTADERRAAGLPKLSANEVPKLDAFINRYQNAKLARVLLAPPTYLARSSRVTPTEAKKEREIHGSFSLSYGFGSGGYSEKTGSMMLRMDDPAGRYSIGIGYSESHIKGGHVYRDPFYDRDYLYGRDPFYGNDPFHDRDIYHGRESPYGRDRLYGRDPFYDSRRGIPSAPLHERP